MINLRGFVVLAFLASVAFGMMLIGFISAADFAKRGTHTGPFVERAL